MKVIPFKSKLLIKKLQVESILLHHKELAPTFTTIPFPTKIKMQFDVLLIFPSHGLPYLKAQYLYKAVYPYDKKFTSS